MITVCSSDTGKFMVKAVNDAGEAQSIADLIISEPVVESILESSGHVGTEHIDQTRVSTALYTNCNLNIFNRF